MSMPNAPLVIQSDGKLVVAGSTYDGSRSNIALARYNSNGTLDASFGTGGIVTTSVGFDSSSAYALAIQSDGKLVIAGYGNYEGAIARYNSDGSLDTSFGTSGITTDSGFGYANALAIQSDGKLVIAGSSGLARYNPDGFLDTSFGSGSGVVQAPPGWEIRSLAIQPDGKLLVAGHAPEGGWGWFDDFALARYNQDGSLDTSFGIGGKVTTGIHNTDWANTLIIQPDGKIVVAGSTDLAGLWDPTTQDFALVRYNSNGTLDTSFGTGGRVQTDMGGKFDTVHALAVQSDGKLVAAGANGSDFAITRYTLTGTLDTSFSGDGKLLTSFGGKAFAYAVAVQGDSRLVVAGNAEGDFALVRYNPDGNLDTGFDSDGKVVTNLGTGWFGVSNDAAYALAVQRDGKLVIAGSSDGAIALVRYNTSDGSLDTGFGVSGIVTTGIPNSFTSYGANTLAIQSDGKIVVAGRGSILSVGNVLVLARYNSDGSLDNNFGLSGIVTNTNSSRDPLLTIQPDGKLIVAGDTDDYCISLARYNFDGSLDATFGVGGIITNSIPEKRYYFSVGALAIQPDSKIVIAGTDTTEYGYTEISRQA